MGDRSEPPMAASVPDRGERRQAMYVHLSGILTSFGAPFLVWRLSKGRADKRFLAGQAMEALNFQATMVIAFAGAFVLANVSGLPAMYLASPAALASVVFGVMAALKAGEGDAYRYPFAWRLVK